jgi:hypothetical protein
MIQIYLRVLYGTRNKQQLFAHTTLIDLFLKTCQRVLTARYGLSLYSNSVLFTCFYGSRNKPRLFTIKNFLLDFRNPIGVCLLRCAKRDCNIIQLYLQALRGPLNRKRLFFYAEITNGFLKASRRVFTARYELRL